MKTIYKVYHSTMALIIAYFVIKVIIQIINKSDCIGSTILLLLINLNIWLMVTKSSLGDNSERRHSKNEKHISR